LHKPGLTVSKSPQCSSAGSLSPVARTFARFTALHINDMQHQGLTVSFVVAACFHALFQQAAAMMQKSRFSHHKWVDFPHRHMPAKAKFLPYLI